MRLDINYNKNLKNTNTWRLSNTFLNNQQVTEEIKREIKKFLEINDNENMTTQNLWDAAKAVLRGKFYSNTILPQETKKTSNSNLTLHLKQLEKRRRRRTTTTKISRRKEIIKI